MLYRLLRNNKESGPFTTIQLKEMGLKPYDLLWTEGRGAAWQYASEIPELKDFAPVVEEQPFDRFFKRKEALETAQQPAVVTKKTKPRFRISNGQLIMIEAGNMEVANNGAIKETMPVRLPKEPVVAKETVATTDWQDTYSQWQPQPQKEVVKEAKPVEVETKYSESLDDLKKRYAEKVLNEKNDKPSSVSTASVKQNIMAAVALIVLAVGGYIGYTLKQKNEVTTEGKPALERADIAGDNALSAQQPNNDIVVDNNTVNTQKTTTDKRSTGVNKSTVKSTSEVDGKPTISAVVKTAGNALTPQNTLIKKDITTVVKSNLSANKTIDKESAATQKNETVKANNNSVITKPLPQQPANATAKTTTGNTSSVPVETKPIVKQETAKKIDDYLSVKKLGGGSSSVQNVRLLVNNVSDFPIDLAVIDIQYFDSKGKYQKGETMYVKNIDGGNNVEVRVPDSDKSSSIKYKVSLVSSEKKTLYLVAD